MRLAGLIAFLALWPATTFGQSARFALIAGSDRGAKDEPNLRFAERDAARLGEVLVDVGGFPPENVLVLRGRDADAMRKALIALNDRIRALTEDPAQTPLLFVYFSGHADSKALHFQDTTFELEELEQLVRGSAARFRLLLLDACRSGSLTQVKGGSIIPPFPIRIEDRQEGEGVVFLTSSAASEDAQESEELGGSFFTHYFITALLGAADENDDGKIGLREAHAYAYEHTLRASSRTLAGAQHPTFKYELRGKSDLTLSQPYSGKERGILEFPEPRTYFVLAKSADGPVIAEIGAHDRVRRITVAPGKYFLRSRGRDHLLEGTVEVAAGARRVVADSELEKFAYARLVRKGGGPISFVHGTEVGYRAHGPVLDGSGYCHGGVLSQHLDLEMIGLLFSAAACRSSFANEALSASTTELAFELGVDHAWDLAPLAFEVTAGAGWAIFHQTFESRGEAPARWASAPLLSASAGVELDFGAGFHLGGEFGGALYLIELDDGRRAAPVMRAGLSAGKRW